MSVAFVATIVHHLDVVDAIGDKVAENLVISLCREAELPVVHLETIVVSGNDVN